MNNIERSRFNLFRADVLKCERITIESLWILLNRHTQGYMGRRIFGGDKGKLMYYRHWIRLLVGQGVLQETAHFGHWKVINLDRILADN